MGAFLAYNLKLSVCFVLFYLVYRLLFCRNTFYRSNRLILLSAYFFSLCIPFLNIPTAGTTEVHEFIGNYELFLLQTFDSPVSSMFEQASLNWADIVVAIYVTGVFFFILRYIYFTIRIRILIGSGEKINLSDGITLVINEKNAIPFTWMNYIIVSKADYLENNENILRHETAHIKYRHSVDLLIAELFTVFQWYNPAIWFIKNELKDVHEYEADCSVLNSGINAKQYQLLLIKKAVGSQRFNSMTNSLNHSKLKKRITMMMKKKNSNWERLKYLVVFPVAAFAVALFARPEISTRLDKISEVKVSTFTSFIEENSRNYADTVKVRPEKKREKAIKVPDLPDDPQQIDRSKEWEEFFKTTSPQEFMDMVKEIKKKNTPFFSYDFYQSCPDSLSQPYFYFQSMTPAKLVNRDSLTQLIVGSFQLNFDSLSLNRDSLMQLNFPNHLFNDSVRVAWRENADRLRMQSKEQIQKQREEIKRQNELIKKEVQRQKEEIIRQSELMKAEAQRQKEEIKRQNELKKKEQLSK